MPQLNPEFFISQLFWLIVTFSFLLIFLWRISLPRISSVLEKRENKISNDLDEAKHLQIEAENIQNDLEKKLLESRESASALVKKSIEDMQNNANFEISKLDKELDKKISDSANIINKNKEESLKNIDQRILEITKMIISKLSSIKVEDEEIKRSVLKIQSKPKG
tara:strand:+ start:229 stop:723 length:495 start_codon:yes stop_codon:yes gene_type:complete